MVVKIIFIFHALLIYASSLYFSKLPIPTLFLNQKSKFNLTLNTIEDVRFNLISGPSFVNLTENGQITFIPNSEGTFQMIIQCINVTTYAWLETRSYFLNVIERKKLSPNLWVLDQQSYEDNKNSLSLSIKVNNFNFDQPIMTNQNIRLQLEAVNSIKKAVWFYQGMPRTMEGGKNNGIISGYVQNQRNLTIKCTAIDSEFRKAEIYLFLKFIETPINLQNEPYFDYGWKNPYIFQQKKQNALMIQKQLQNLLQRQKQLKSQRKKLIQSYKQTQALRQLSKSNETAIILKISQKTSDLKKLNAQLQSLKNQQKTRKQKVQQQRKILDGKISLHSMNLQRSKTLNKSKQVLLKQTKEIKNEFQSLKKDIKALESIIYQQQNQLRDIQYERSRSNVSFVTYQKQQIRTREILEIRKNIEFQYLIKKAQTDNKVRRAEDFVFLSQSNYDFAYSQLQRQSLQYIKYSIEASYLQNFIDDALKQYDEMRKVLSKAQLNYEIALGQVNTLKVTQNQLSKLIKYTVNNAIKNAKSQDLTQTEVIQLQAQNQLLQYPFTGCKIRGNFAWAGTGQIKFIGKNFLTLNSQQTVNFGSCTQIKNKPLQIGQWIQFYGYYWNDAVQSNKILLVQAK